MPIRNTLLVAIGGLAGIALLIGGVPPSFLIGLCLGSMGTMIFLLFAD